MINTIKQFFSRIKNLLSPTRYEKLYNDSLLEIKELEESHMIFVKQIEAILKEEKQRRVSTRFIDTTQVVDIPEM